MKLFPIMYEDEHGIFHTIVAADTQDEAMELLIRDEKNTSVFLVIKQKGIVCVITNGNDPKQSLFKEIE